MMVMRMAITPSLNASIRFVFMRRADLDTAAVTPEAGGVAYKSWAIWRSVTLLTLTINEVHMVSFNLAVGGV